MEANKNLEFNKKRQRNHFSIRNIVFAILMVIGIILGAGMILIGVLLLIRRTPVLMTSEEYASSGTILTIAGLIIFLISLFIIRSRIK